MPEIGSRLNLGLFETLGDLLRYLRRRARISQRDLSIAVGYSESQISRLESNRRPPDLATLAALFAPALHIEDEPEILARLLELAAQARGEPVPDHAAATQAGERRGAEAVLSPLPEGPSGRKHNLPLQWISGKETWIGRLTIAMPACVKRPNCPTATFRQAPWTYRP